MHHVQFCSFLLLLHLLHFRSRRKSWLRFEGFNYRTHQQSTQTKLQESSKQSDQSFTESCLPQLYITLLLPFIIPEFQQKFLTTVFLTMLWNFSRIARVHRICYIHVLLPESTLNLKNSNGMHETPMLRYRLQTNCNGWMDRKRKWIQAVLRWELNCNWFQYRLPSPLPNLFPLSSASINPHSVSIPLHLFLSSYFQCHFSTTNIGRWTNWSCMWNWTVVTKYHI